MARVSDERVLVRVYGRTAAETVRALVAARWPHADARYQYLDHGTGTRKELVMVTADRFALKDDEGLIELVRYAEGVADGLVSAGVTEAVPPMPF